MVFSSLSFICFFLPLTALVYFALPYRGWRNGVLLASSLLFYAWGEPRLIISMLIATLVAYVGGLIMDGCGHDCAEAEENGVRSKQKDACDFGYRKKKTVFVITVILLTANLFVFKYFNFAADNFARILGLSADIMRIALPVGISFYTFQILSYVIDLWRGEIAVQKNFARLLLYVCLFPQLIAGPIVRYSTVEQELTDRRETVDDAYAGTMRFITGLGKKVLLANNLAKISEMIYGGSSFGTSAYWLAALAYALQIYFDFSGYSDMAIGMGRIFGFNFLENFNRPYLSTSVSDFWRRWHISLSSWFRDYIYIPLGGNRRGSARRILNILIVWTLTGMWHGAEWNFMWWGLYYGVLLIAEKALTDFFRRAGGSKYTDTERASGGTAASGHSTCSDSENKISAVLCTVLRWLITMIIVLVGWVIFNRGADGQLQSTLSMMFSFTATDWGAALRSNAELLYALIWIPAGILTVIFERGKDENGSRRGAEDGLLPLLWHAIILLICITYLLSAGYNPFIYFRF